MVMCFDSDYFMVENIVDIGECLLVYGRLKTVGCLFSIDKVSGKPVFKSFVPEDKDRHLRYAQIFVDNNRIFFVPRSANALDIYDIRTGGWKSYKIDIPYDKNIKYEYSSRSKFSFAFIREDILYLFPDSYPCIIKVDIHKESLEYLYHLMNYKIEYEGRILAFAQKGFSDGKYVTFYSRVCRSIMRFDMESCSLECLYKIPDESNCYRMMEYDGHNYWLFPQNEREKIIRYGDSNDIEEIKFHVEGFEYWRISFFLSVLSDGYIWLLPGMADEVLRFDLHNKMMERSSELQLEYIRTDREIEQWKYLCAESKEGILYAYDGNSGELESIRLSDGIKKKERIKISGEEKNKMEIEYLITRMI